MPVKMPLTAPTREIGSIGQVKVDRERVPNFVEYVPAAEWNNVCDELIATAQLALNLAAAGSTGTLQQVYNNGVGPSTLVILDTVRNGFVISDGNPSIGSGGLLSVLNTNGFPLFTISNDTFQIAPNQCGIGTDPTGRNALRMTSDSGSLLPYSSAHGNIGASDLPWNSLYALRTSHARATIPYSPTPVFNAANGSYLSVTLTGNITDFTIPNILPGQVVTCIFRQDGTGGRRCTAAISGVKLKDGQTHLPLTAGANGYDAFVFARNDADSETIEIGRKLARNPEIDYAYTDLSAASGTIEFTPWVSAHTQHFNGALSDAVTLTLKSGRAYPGMRFRFVFDETGLLTTNLNTLTITAEGGQSISFNQVKTLRGIIECIYGVGNIWYLCLGGALSYA